MSTPSFLPRVGARPAPPCCVCSSSSDLEMTSAHFAGVWRFCTRCGLAFHSPETLEFVREAARLGRAAGGSGTVEQWKAIERWIFSSRAQLAMPATIVPPSVAWGSTWKP